MNKLQELDFLTIFKNNFLVPEFKGKKIVLYGLGLKTQQLLENLNSFDLNIIGLMDKEPENIGKAFWGFTVLDNNEVINTADLIVIVSSDVYFETIFSRIEFLQNEHNIPIYFCDGTKAQSPELDTSVEQNPYWQKTLKNLKTEIDKNEVISFDIFDTLITRKIAEPVDLLKLIGKLNNADDFATDRIKAEIELGNSATIEKIYKKLINHKIKPNVELEFELKNIIPRYEILEAFNYAKKQKKEIYLISDIYYSKKFIKKILDKFGIKGYKDLLISCELGKRKSDKTLWEFYSAKLKCKSTLHIGDNFKDDIEKAKEFGINTFHILSPYEMFKHSTLKNIVPQICSMHESLIIGNIISRIFNSPFALSNTKGKPFFDSLKDLGYVFFAPVLFTYLCWILKENINNKTDKILFVARDGYFLEKLYKFIVKALKIKNAPKSKYLMISRTLITVANLKNDEDIKNALKIKFQGKSKDYFKIRFGIDIEDDSEINTANDMEKIKYIIELNKAKILENAKNQRELYLKYLNSVVNPNEKITIVDPSYKGTNQYFLSKILNKHINGYYCNADLSSENPYFNHNMFALFQAKDDLQARKSGLRKNCILFEEGILVAPEGICLGINKNQSFNFAEKGNTQMYFVNKEEIFEGVIEFFEDILQNYQCLKDIEISSQFVDFIIEELYTKNTTISKDLKDKFYVDTMYEAIFDRKLFE